uniref:Uncharacterized protein n=1 Tax=Arundo donax TaxID=35708 RepID=A0A0A9A0I5_ARUDO
MCYNFILLQSPGNCMDRQPTVALFF